jgi:hypothetical protein
VQHAAPFVPQPTQMDPAQTSSVPVHAEPEPMHELVESQQPVPEQTSPAQHGCAGLDAPHASHAPPLQICVPPLHALSLVTHFDVDMSQQPVPLHAPPVQHA